MTEEELKALDKANEEAYGTPEKKRIVASPIKCEHYYVRKSATVFGCQNCTNHWIDNGEFIFENGKLVGMNEHPQNLPLEN